MLRELEELSPQEVDQIKKVIQDLFRSTCILQMKCDADTLVQRDNIRYQHCMKYREFIADYLELMGCELIYDSQEQLFRIVGEGALIEKMSLLTTRLVVLMKLIYHDKIMGEGLHATVTTLEEIRQYGTDTHLLTRKLTEQEWQEALVLMRTHQMVTFAGAAANLEDDSPIYIYGTVNIFCNTVSLGELVEYYKVSAEQDVDTGVEGQYEAVEEDLY
ncbi:MAG: DUF4194 domain-containing protein [Lachnospiraceae bacterium]